jgi:Na+/phosphate symporter
LKPFSFLTRDASSFVIALTHTIFNLASVIVLSPFSKYIGRLSELSVKGNEAVKITRRSPEPDYNTRSSPVERLGQVQLEFSSLLSDAADTASLSASLIYRNSDENSILDQIGTRVSLAERRINELDVFINETSTSELTFNGRIRLSALRDMLPMLQNVFIISFAVSEELSESSAASVSNETFSRLSSLLDAYHDVMLLTAKAQSEDDTATAHRIIPFAEAILSALEDAGYERVELTNLSYKIASSVSFCSTVAANVIRSHLGGSSFEMREYMRMYSISPEYSSILKETRKRYSL